MTQTQGLVSISIDITRGHSGSLLLELSGYNTGNLLFTHGVSSQITNPRHLGFKWDPDEVRESCDILVIPAANWVGAHQDLGFLADLIEDTRLPVCCVGLGGQIDIDHISTIPKGTKRFLSALSHHSEYIGLRGDYTREILHKLRIQNTKVLGCPSMFPHLTTPLVNTKTFSSGSKLAMSFTRYGVDTGTDELQRELARIAVRCADSIVLQSETEEILHLAGEPIKMDQLAQYYGLSKSEMALSLDQKFKVFSDTNAWVNHLSRFDWLISSRIHGCVSAILAGIPSLLLTHDHRTRELSEFMGIPSLPLEEARPGKYLDIWNLQDSFDLDKFNAIQQRNLKALRQFYRDCGVETKNSTS